MKNPKILCCLLFLAFTGIALLTTGLVIYYILPEIVDAQLKLELSLTEDSMAFEKWSKLDFPIESEIFLFNVTNPQAVLKGSKPIVEELGPYVYRQPLLRENIVFNNDGTVSYDLIPSFFFDRNKSVGPESDTFTTINIPVVAVNNGMRFMSSYLRLFAETVLHLDDEPLFLKLTVRDILWGYQDSFIKRMASILPTFGQEFPDHFGLLYQDNNTKMGSYKIQSGQHDISKVGSIVTWNGERSLSHWTTDQCQMINGSDGTIFPPFMNREETMYFFNSFYCRSFPLVYENDTKIKQLDTYRFVVPSLAFASPAENPANKGFCTPLGNCPPSGLINISHCNVGAPVFLSQPHYRDADPSLQTSVGGLSPDPKLHQTVMEFEPLTGASLRSTQRSQVNIYVDKQQFRESKDFDFFYLPVMWLAVNVDSGGLADEIQDRLFELKALVETLTYAALGVGAFIILCSLIFATILMWKNKKNH